ncbi:MAG: peptide-methionine (R)-S-oxide reductase MsrB [Gammaproteobacteria bacterium]|nr:peptide-methionine (R)-S-oxide reductase MsrB [Gammaproteobacteria bacterium]
MKRRHFLISTLGLIPASIFGTRVMSNNEISTNHIEKVIKSDAEWAQLLTPEQYHILRQEGTEAPYSSSLNNEKQDGVYVCAACELPLFNSDMKYDSGTGWPSFFTTIDANVATKRDFKLIYPRTEYHCARCEGHQGHVFKDGPKPSGKRWCNNGLALKFMPA